MNSPKPYCLFTRLLWPLMLCVLLILGFTTIKAQEKPPRPIKVTVSVAQHLNFGSIVPISDAGGTVEVYHDNSSVKSGDILQLRNSQCSSALFIVDSEPGVLINIIYPNTNLELRNGSYHMKLELTSPYIDKLPTYKFVTKGNTTYVYIGGILSVGNINDNPSGSYFGTFPVTFIQE